MCGLRLLIEELNRELPQGWVMLRRTPNTDRADGFIEMCFTGDTDLIAENAKLKRENEGLFDLMLDQQWTPDEIRDALANPQEQRDCDNCEITGLRCPIRNEQEFTFPCEHWQPLADTRESGK